VALLLVVFCAAGEVSKGQQPTTGLASHAHETGTIESSRGNGYVGFPGVRRLASKRETRKQLINDAAFCNTRRSRRKLTDFWERNKKSRARRRRKKRKAAEAAADKRRGRVPYRYRSSPAERAKKKRYDYLENIIKNGGWLEDGLLVYRKETIQLTADEYDFVQRQIRLQMDRARRRAQEERRKDEEAARAEARAARRCRTAYWMDPANTQRWRKNGCLNEDEKLKYSKLDVDEKIQYYVASCVKYGTLDYESTHPTKDISEEQYKRNVERINNPPLGDRLRDGVRDGVKGLFHSIGSLFGAIGIDPDVWLP